MRIRRLLAATALTCGLALTGAGTAQATEWTYNLFGPFADQAACTESTVWWFENHPVRRHRWLLLHQHPATGVGYGWFHYVYSPI